MKALLLKTLKSYLANLITDWFIGFEGTQTVKDLGLTQTQLDAILGMVQKEVKKL